MPHHLYLLAAVLWLWFTAEVWRHTHSTFLVRGNIVFVVVILATAVARPELWPLYVKLPLGVAVLWAGSRMIGKSQAAMQEAIAKRWRVGAR